MALLPGCLCPYLKATFITTNAARDGTLTAREVRAASEIGYGHSILHCSAMTLNLTQPAIAEVIRLANSLRGTADYQRAHIGTSAVASDDSATVSIQLIQIRLNLVPGGCAEQRYQLDFASPDAVRQVGIGVSEARSNETKDQSSEGRTVDCGPVQVQIGADAWPYVQQLTVVYVEDLMGGSFRFENPDLSRACNCGQSFYL